MNTEIRYLIRRMSLANPLCAPRIHGELAIGGRGNAMALVEVLKQCGDDPSRENIMRQAANLHDLELPNESPRHHYQHQSRRLPAYQADAGDALQRRELGATERGNGPADRE
jgi:hypothetical protein